MSSPEEPPPFDPFPRASSELVYDSPWCRLRRDQIVLESGRHQEYHVFEVPDAVAIVPVLPDGSIVMLWQYRYPHGKTHWEIPSGRTRPGEPPEEAARRELFEETGYEPSELERIAGFYPLNGISPHFAHLFVARGCRRKGAAQPEETERLSVHVVPEAEARKRLHEGRFADGFTALGLFYHLFPARPSRDPS